MLSVLQRSETAALLKNVLPIVHVIITSKVSVTILQSYVSLPRHICKGILQQKGGLFRHIYVHHLIASNLAKDLNT